MRRVVGVLALVSLFLGSLATDVARADIVYTDVGFDPNDVSGPAIEDIEFTRRTVSTNANGRRSVRVRVRAYEPLGPNVDIRVVLDYDGDPRKDAYVALVSMDGVPWCFVKQLGVASGWMFDAEKLERTISCAFPLRILHPMKRIRWRVRSPDPGIFDPADIDYAPDQGWYE